MEKIFPNWRWHYSASWGTGQIPICRIEVPKTSIFMIFRFLGPIGTFICEFEYISSCFQNLRETQIIVGRIIFGNGMWKFVDCSSETLKSCKIENLYFLKF